MCKNIKIDLHIHSNISDGTDSPEMIVLNVKKHEITHFSVTDHDSIKSSKIIPGLLDAKSPYYITGVEFSCKDEEGKYHILGYGYNPDAKPIQEIVKTGHSFRMKKLETRIDLLNKYYNISFSKEDIEKLFAMDNPGKPHIGNLLVRSGYAETKDEAIRKYLNPLKIINVYIRPEEAIDAILKSGGIPVLAHPSFGNGEQLFTGKDMEHRLCRLIEYGLKGVEAFYSGFSSEIRNEILAFAEKYDLYVTAGSDYHGENKKVMLGETGMDLTCGNIPDGMLKLLQMKPV